MYGWRRYTFWNSFFLHFWLKFVALVYFTWIKFHLHTLASDFYP
jgi:hypothetical protein